MKKLLSLIAWMMIINHSTVAQDSLSSAQLIEDLTIMGNIAIGISPNLTDEDRTRIDQLIELKKKKLDGKTFTAIEFFNFLSTIDFETKFDEHARLSIREP